MRSRAKAVFHAALAAALFLLPVATAARDETDIPPLSAFAQLPPINDVDLSPDGTRLVMLRAIGETYHAVLADFEQGEMRPLMAADPENFLFNWCRWANDERVVCSIRSYITLRATQLPGQIRRYRDGRAVVTRLLAINADGSKQLQLVPNADTRPGDDLTWNAQQQDQVISWLRDDPNHILIQLRREEPNNPSVYRLNIYNNRMSRVRRAHGSVLRWYADRHGELRLAAGYRNTSPIAFSVQHNRLKEVDLTGLHDVRPPSVVGISHDGGSAYVFANGGRDTRGLYRVNSRTGAVSETIFTDPDYDVDGRLLKHPRSGEPLALRYHRGGTTVKWFDEDLARRFESLRQRLPGGPSHLELQTFDTNVRRMVFTTEGNRTLPRHYLYDSDHPDALVLLSTAYEQLGDAVEPAPVSYRARDGLTIPAYLTLPPDRPDSRRPYPTVVMPHGGPWVRDSSRFDYWVQFLVSRGYAVLQPNFRGSSGYGDRFLSAGFGQWGETMQDDIIDGLDWLIEQGIADPDRVCMVGASYGGYAALVASFKTPDRLRCAVSFAGVSDLNDMAIRLWNLDLGELTIARLPDGPARRQNSPLQQVDKINVPLLLVHGDVDRTVMIEQSRQLVDALEIAGKPYRYIEQTNGDHHLSLLAHRVQLLEAMEEFLATNLAP